MPMSLTLSQEQRLRSFRLDADAETEVELLQLGQAGADELERLVRQLLTILQTQLLQVLGAVTELGRLDAAAEVGNAVVGDLAAGPQVQLPQVLHAPCDQDDPIVGDLAAASKVQDFEALAVGGNPANAVVAHLLAERDVQLFELWHLLRESSFDGALRQIVAS